MAALAVVLALAACARSGPPAPVVDRSGALHPPPTTRSPVPPPEHAGPARAPRPAKASAPPAVTTAPVAAVTPAPPQTAPPEAEGKLLKQGESEITVRRGDTLYGIARRHKVPMRTLVDANGLRPPYRLKVGDRLHLPGVRVYVVAKGDTVYAVGRRFGVPPARIIRENRIKEAGHRLIPSQKLILPSGPSTTAAAIGPLPRGEASKPDSRAKPALRGIPASVRADRVVRPSSPPPRSGRFLWPIQGQLVSSFGAKGGGLFNDGINIAADEGAPVRAAENGVVAYAGNELRGYGNLLLIRHSGGWVSAYAHNSRLLVKKGQVVRRGQTIARVGRSGGVGQPQLHFELRRGPEAVDPLRHLPKRS